MAVIEMGRRESHRLGYEYEETIADGADGDSIRIFPVTPNGGAVTCGMIAGANTGKFQTTTSPDAKVLAGTAVWSDWPKGDITGTDHDVIIGPVTGVRGVSVSGEIKIEVLM